MAQGAFIPFPLLANVWIIELERSVEVMLQTQLSFMEKGERPDMPETFQLFKRGIIKVSSVEELEAGIEMFGQNRVGNIYIYFFLLNHMGVLFLMF